MERQTRNLLSGLLLSYFPGILKTFFRGFLRVRFTIGVKIITRTTFIVGELFCNYTHISYTTLIGDELIYVMRVYLWCLLVLPL